MYHKLLTAALMLAASTQISANTPVTSPVHTTATKSAEAQPISLWLTPSNRYQSVSAARSPLSSGCQAVSFSWLSVHHRQGFFCRQDTAILPMNFATNTWHINHAGDSLNESLALRANVANNRPWPAPSFVAVNTSSSQQTQFQGYYAAPTWGIGTNIIRDAGYKHRSDRQIEQLQWGANQQHGNVTLTHHLQLLHHQQELAGLVADTATPNNKKAYQKAENRRFNPNNNSQQQGEILLASTEAAFDVGENKVLTLKPYATAENFEQQDQQHFSGIDWQYKKQSLGLLGAFTRPALTNSQLTTGFNIDYSQGSLQQQSLDTPSLKQLDYQLSSVQIASFMQLQSKLSPQLESKLGLRLENSRYHYHNKLDNGAICDNQGNCPFARTGDDKQSFFHIAPSAAIHWHYFKQHQSFWRFYKRTRAPSHQQLYQSQQNITPSSLQEIASYTVEWGLQGQTKAIFYQLIGYAQKNHGLIIEMPDKQQFQNHKSLRLGAQVHVRWQLSKAWQLEWFGDIANERYISSSPTIAIQDKRVAMAPTQMHRLRLQWEITPTNTLQASWRSINRYFLDAGHSASYKGHQLLDLVFKQAVTNRLSWQLGVENISNEYYASYSELSDTATAGKYLPRYDVGLGRTWQLGLHYAFK